MPDMESALEAQIPALRRYAFALMRDSAAADDLVQDCLERAISRWYLRRDGDLRAWLFTIMRNLHVSAARQRKRRGGIHDDINEVVLPGVSGGQESAVGCRDILDALNLLSEEQKSVVLLVGVEDVSYDNAAKLLGIPVGTVMSRLSRGRDRLRFLLGGPAGTGLRRVK